MAKNDIKKLLKVICRMLEFIGNPLKTSLETVNDRIVEEIDVENIIKEIVGNAFYDACTAKGMEWNEKILDEYIKDNRDKSNWHLFKLSCDDIKQMMCNYPKAEVISLEEKVEPYWLDDIDEDWHDKWTVALNKELENSNDIFKLVCSWFINNIYNEANINRGYNDNDYSDKEDLIEIMEKAIETARNGDMYANINYLDDIIYKFVMDNLTEGCSLFVIELGYKLADIYDYIAEYEKSNKIANLIFKIITDSETDYSIEQLRKLIGCTYSLTIIKEKDPALKESQLEIAKERYLQIKEYLDDIMRNQMVEIMFTSSLYESDYGAWCINKADLANNMHDDEDKQMYLEMALQHHKAAERIRSEICELFEDRVDSIEYNNAVKQKYQSKSNIAGILYRLGQFDKAIKMHKEVLAYREKNNLTSLAILSREYIAGAYIEKWKAAHILEKEKEECKELLVMCKEYYVNNNNPRRLTEVLSKIKEYDKLS